MHQDWFKVWRRITESKVFANPDILKLWILCLKKANWTDRVIMWDGATETIWVKRGQFVTGRESLHAEYYKVNRGARKTSRTVWRWLKQLESWQSIVLESVQGVTLVTLCNHGIYNDADENVSSLVTTECPDRVQTVSRPCPDDVQTVSTEEEGLDSSKKVKNRKKEKKPTVVFPDGLDTDDFRAKWAEWEQHRKEKRSAITPTTRKKQMADMEAIGHDRAIAAIEYSMRQGWSGIFEQKDKSNGKSTQSDRNIDAAAKWLQGKAERGELTE